MPFEKYSSTFKMCIFLSSSVIGFKRDDFGYATSHCVEVVLNFLGTVLVTLLVRFTHILA